MSGQRVYPDDTAGPFPSPPATIDDREGRRIRLRALDRVPDEESFEALVDMYVAFDPADRAQGIPPAGETRVREWLEQIATGAIHVVACHDGRVIGHATLVPDGPDGEPIEDPSECVWELAIFVLQAYQRAGIGTHLLKHLLGHASDRGVERIWLTVERFNHPAISLYERVGFETCGAESFEQEMAIRLA